MHCAVASMTDDHKLKCYIYIYICLTEVSVYMLCLVTRIDLVRCFCLFSTVLSSVCITILIPQLEIRLMAITKSSSFI